MAQLTDIPDDLAIVVVHPGGPKGKRLVDACKAASARVVTCAKVKPADRLMFVQEEIRRLGGSVTAGACRAIVEAIGGELRELAGAASQLVADVPGTIDEGAVARFFRGRAEVSGFDVADRALAGDLAGALGELRAALGGGLDPVPIIAALAGKLRTAARVASAGRNARREAVAADLGIAPWMVDKARKQITGWTPDALAAAYTAVARADWAAKGGGTDAKYAVERAVLEVVAQRRGTAVGANA
jgi:DNA polymerase-3 subunit delta